LVTSAVRKQTAALQDKVMMPTYVLKEDTVLREVMSLVYAQLAPSAQLQVLEMPVNVLLAQQVLTALNQGSHL
jgi:hypothetical protein